MDWQPIDTAPKDGTPLLLTIVGAVLEPDEDTHCDIGRWDRDFTGKENWCMNRGDFWPGATHWLPIPAAPQLAT